MSDWNYGELINRRPHSHSVASNSTQPMETELSREREAHNHTKRERDEAREQLRKASVEANTLATSIQKTEYPDAKEFELLGSVAGVISQIDNMYAGVRQQRDEARAALMKIEDVFVDGEDTYEDWRTMGNIARAALEGWK